MNIIEEAKRLLHSEDHRGLHPELHGFLRGVAEQKPACNATAQKIAERVPMPEHHESAVVCLTPEGYAHGNMIDVQLQVLQGARLRRGDVLYTAAQMEALRLAVAAEAVRVSSAQSPDALKLSDHALARMPLRGAEAVAKIERAPNGMIGLFRPDGGPFDMSKYVGATLYTTPPAGSVEVTADRVERAARTVCEFTGQDWDAIGPFAQLVLIDTQRAALTAALQEPK